MKLITENISHEQRKMIYALCKDLKIDDDTRHELMQEWAGVSSLAADKCSAYKAGVTIECLNKLKGKDKDEPRGTATIKQIRAIKSIARSYRWNTGRLTGFIKHTLQLDSAPSLDSLDTTQASTLITGLKRMSYSSK